VIDADDEVATLKLEPPGANADSIIPEYKKKDSAIQHHNTPYSKKNNGQMHLLK
jgi:hypothetical protein